MQISYRGQTFAFGGAGSAVEIVGSGASVVLRLDATTAGRVGVPEEWVPRARLAHAAGECTSAEASEAVRVAWEECRAAQIQAVEDVLAIPDLDDEQRARATMLLIDLREGKADPGDCASLGISMIDARRAIERALLEELGTHATMAILEQALRDWMTGRRGVARRWMCSRPNYGVGCGSCERCKTADRVLERAESYMPREATLPEPNGAMRCDEGEGR